jgi:hypothetical protein
MTILRPGKKRRDPLGMHECCNCGCRFVIQHADPLPKPNDRGGIVGACPNCGWHLELNGFVLNHDT